MDEEQKQPARFWPMVFIAAFGLGAVLWSLWMYKFVRETREHRENGFFVPPAVEQKGTNAGGGR